MGKSKIRTSEKINAVHDILNGKESITQVAERLSVDKSTVREWVMAYNGCSIEEFVATTKKPYSAELKLQAVAAYISGKGSLYDICQRFGIKGKSVLRRWLKKYNDHEELKASGTGGQAAMTKRRKTTFDERVEIVQYCIAHNHNYAEAAEKYDVSYQQARSYTVKYETGGLEALEDRRGKRKPEDALSEVEKLRVELKLEKTRRQRAEMEVSFLKKLEEIERRRG